MAEFDIVIRNGTVVTATETTRCDVGIRGVEPVGNYGVKPLFTDGHESGIFTWDYLYKLGNEQAALWQDYLGRLHAAGYEGDSGRDASAVPAAGPKGGGCGSGGCSH